MRVLLFALPLFLAACASDPAPSDAPGDAAPGDAATGDAAPPATAVDDAAPAPSATDAAFLVGTWEEAGRKTTLDGILREGSGTIVWTFRDDGTAFHAQTFEGMGPVTEDLTWSLDGAALVLRNAATGDVRHALTLAEQGDAEQGDAEQGDGTLTLHHADRSTYYVLERAE